MISTLVLLPLCAALFLTDGGWTPPNTNKSAQGASKWRICVSLMMVGSGGVGMGKVLLRLNAASPPSLFGVELMTLLMANPDTDFVIKRDGEVVEVRVLDSDDN